MQICLALFDSNISYGRQLAGLLRRYQNPAIAILPFTGLEDYLDRGRDRPVDGLILDQELLDDFLALQMGKREGRTSAEAAGVELTRDPRLAALLETKKIVLSYQLAPHLPPGYESVYKYQGVEGIYKSLVNLFSSLLAGQTLEAREGGAQCLFFAQACGGVGATLLAQALALHLARSRIQEGERVFFLGHDPHDYGLTKREAASHLGLHPEGDMEDLALAIHSRKTDLGIKVKALEQTLPEGLHFILQAKNQGPQDLLRADGMADFLDFLTQHYDWLICDWDPTAGLTAEAGTRDHGPAEGPGSAGDHDAKPSQLGEAGLQRVLVSRPDLLSLSRAYDCIDQAGPGYYQALIVNGGGGQIDGGEPGTYQASELLLDHLQQTLPVFTVPSLPVQGEEALAAEIQKIRRVSRLEAVEELAAFFRQQRKGVGL